MQVEFENQSEREKSKLMGMMDFMQRFFVIVVYGFMSLNMCMSRNVSLDEKVM